MADSLLKLMLPLTILPSNSLTRSVWPSLHMPAEEYTDPDPTGLRTMILCRCTMGRAVQQEGGGRECMKARQCSRTQSLTLNLILITGFLFLLANIVTTSEALVTSSDALVPSSFLLRPVKLLKTGSDLVRVCITKGALLGMFTCFEVALTLNGNPHS